MTSAQTEGMIDTSSLAIGAVGIVLVVASVIVFGVHRASQSRRLAAIVATGIVAWLAVTASLARSGILSDFTTKPPRLLLVLAGAMTLFTLATTNATARRLLAVTPKHWLIAFQSFRVLVEIGLYALFAAGKLPVQMTFEGRNFDVLVGITAPIVAFAVARGLIGSRVAIAWNLASLGLLLNIMGIATTTMPGPLHLDWPGVSNEIVATAPFVWLPAFLVPVAFFGHVLSLRQLLRLPVGSARDLEIHFLGGEPRSNRNRGRGRLDRA